MNYLPSRKAAKALGLHPNTLRKYAQENKIKYIKNEAGQRLYDVESYSRSSISSSTICYCRVSSYKQQEDLSRQENYLRERYPKAEFIRDIGSGLNYKRKGLRTLLERCMQGDKLQVVVTYKDRLCRFGFELIEFLIKVNGGEILVLNSHNTSPESELTQDLLSILHIFSCRMHGRRSYTKVKEDSYTLNTKPEEIIEALVRSLKTRLQQNNRTSETVRY